MKPYPRNTTTPDECARRLKGEGRKRLSQAPPKLAPLLASPRFWARPLTDLSHCDRWKGQFLLCWGRSQRLPELRPDYRGLLLLLLTAGRAAAVRGMSLLLRAEVPPPSAPALSLAPSSRRLSPLPQLHW